MKKGFFKTTLFALLFCGFGAVLSAQSYSTDNRTLMTIGGDEISVAEFMNVFNKNNVNGDVLDKKSMEEYLDLYINYKLKVKEAEMQGLDTAGSFINELAGYRTQLAKPYFVDEALNEELIAEAYARMQYDVRASHMLFRCEEDALPEDTLLAYNKAFEARERVMAGEDFGAVAVEVSEDPSARDRAATERSGASPGNKGDLGYFTAFNMVYPFETAAYNTAIGDVSMPTRTKFGYHIILVADKKEALGKVLAAHIFFPLRPTASQAQIDTAISQSDRAWLALEAGEPWGDVVKAYSQDKGSAAKQGKLPWFNVNRMVPEVIEELYVLDTNQYSKPFRTSYGYHILMFMDQQPVKSFDDSKGSIKSSLAKDDRAKLGKSSVIKKIKADDKFKSYPKNLTSLYELVSDSIFTGTWRAEELLAMHKKMFVIGDSVLTQKEFAVVLEKKQQHGNVLEEKDRKILINKIYENWVNVTCLAYADSKLEQNHVEFALLMREYRDGILLFELMDAEVWNKAIIDTVGLDNYYQAHAANYVWPERFEASTFTFTGFADQAAIDNFVVLANETLAGSWDEMVLANLEKSDSLLNVNYTTDKYVADVNKDVDDLVAKGGVPSYDVQVNEANKRVVIRTVNSKIEPEAKAFKEAKGQITADYQVELETEWVKALREKYPYTLNEKVWESLK